MPVYEYKCEKCNKQFEVQQSIKEPPLKKHKDCGGKLNKIFYPAGIIFKGSGFYVTDSRKNGKQKTKTSIQNKKDDKIKSSGTATTNTTNNKTETKSAAPSSNNKK